MSAEVLREAAAKMREQAEAVAKIHPAPWDWAEDRSERAASQQRVLGDHDLVHDGKCVIVPVPGFKTERRAISTFLASWDPAVAVALADWLDWVAQCREVMDGVAANVRARGREPQGPGKPTQMFLDFESRALDVARAFLREAA